MSDRTVKMKSECENETIWVLIRCGSGDFVVVRVSIDGLSKWVLENLKSLMLV